MIEIYKIVMGIYDRDACSLLKSWKDVALGTGTRDHPFKIYPQQARTSLRKKLLALRVVNTSNSMPIKVITCEHFQN